MYDSRVSQLASQVESLSNTASNVTKWARVSEPMVETADWPYQTVEYLGSGPAPSIPWTPYGLHSSPPPGTTCLLVCLQGDEGARVHMAGSPNKRPVVIAEGEVVIYHPKSGSYMRFLDDGNITIKAPTVTVEGNLTVTGNTALGATVTSNGVDISDTHKHGAMGLTGDGGPAVGPVTGETDVPV